MYLSGFAQFSPQRRNVPANCAVLSALLEGVRADLLVLPELANSGYWYRNPADLAPYAEPADGSGPFLRLLCTLARKVGGVIVSGFSESAASGLYNSAVAVDASGVLQVYRKTHLFADEKLLFCPGDTGFRSFVHRGVQIGLMICFDWYFPESMRTLALHGAQIVAHTANLVLPHCQTAMVTRCLENRVFGLTCNRYGEESLDGDTLRFTGASQLVDPLGKVISAAPVSGDCVAVCEIDPDPALNKRLGARNDLFADRRPEFYA